MHHLILRSRSSPTCFERSGGRWQQTAIAVAIATCYNVMLANTRGRDHARRVPADVTTGLIRLSASLRPGGRLAARAAAASGRATTASST